MDMIRYETHLPLMNSSKPFKEHHAEREAGSGIIVNWHQSLEIIHVTSGEVEVITNGVSVCAWSGDVAVINSSYLHDIVCNSRASYYCIIINIDFLANFGIKIDEVEFDRLVRTERTAELCRRIRSVCEAKEKNYELVAKADILSLVCELFVNHSHKRDERSELGGGLDGAREVIKYLQAHLPEKLSLEAISDAVGYNKYYVSHVFKSVTGVSVMTYLNMLRTYHARELFRTRSYTVGEVCRMCGFDNLSYFTRTYKKHVGVTPSEDCKDAKKIGKSEEENKREEKASTAPDPCCY